MSRQIPVIYQEQVQIQSAATRTRPWIFTTTTTTAASTSTTTTTSNIRLNNILMCQQIFSGTHAITCALFELLRPGDELLAVVGAPYDTLEEVIGKRDSGGLGSLHDFGVKYREVPLVEDGGLDWNALMSVFKPETKCVVIQRSRGYSWRQSLSVNDIGRAIHIIKMQNPECSVMVDNCYGELVERIEPPMVGADLMAGSLIKNPGGTIAPCGGYVYVKKNLVEAVATHLIDFMIENQIFKNGFILMIKEKRRKVHQHILIGNMQGH